MPLQIVRDDIINVQADAIVNSANCEPIVGRGTDGTIYSAADRDKLLAARKAVGRINFGDAKITPAFDLPAKFIIHTVAPIWNGGTSGEVGLLRACYKNSLSLAVENDCASVAFPLLATGINNFPNDEALRVAVNEIQNFLFNNDLRVVLAVFGKNIFELSRKIFADVTEVVEDKFVASAEFKEYSGGGLHYLRGVQKLNVPPQNRGKNFYEHLLTLIDRSGLTEPQIYRAANLSPKVFSEIRTKSRPAKKTATALALALKLNLSDAQDLLATAGFTLNDALEFDATIINFIRRGVYDINKEINPELYEKNLPTF